MNAARKWKDQIDAQLHARGLSPATDAEMEEANLASRKEWRQARSRVLLGRLDALYRNALVRYAASEQWLEDYRDGVRVNYFLFGKPSTGKTWEACALARRLLMEDAVPVTVISAPNLIEALKPNSEGASDIGQFQVAPVLVLDDLGAERATEYSASQLFLLVDERTNRQLPTIVTTNLTGPEIRTRYEDRLTDRLAARARTCVTEDKTYRNPTF